MALVRYFVIVLVDLLAQNDHDQDDDKVADYGKGWD